ncbi:MAG: transposase [Geminicoccaceae bacterium]
MAERASETPAGRQHRGRRRGSVQQRPHLIENFFCKLKGFRRIATRYEKTDESFSAMIHLVGTVLAIR